MQAMRTPFALTLLAAALLGGCSTTGGKGTIAKDSGHELGNNAFKEYAIRPALQDDAGSLPSGVEPMPFGRSMFGPWDVGPAGAAGRAVPWPSTGLDLVIIVGEELEESGPHDVVEIDLTRGDSHVNWHVLGLRTSYQLVVETSALVCRATVPRRVTAARLLHEVCSQNNLALELDGRFAFIRRAIQIIPESRESALGASPRFSGEFAGSDAVGAIMETAKVSKTQAFIPAFAGESSLPPFSRIRFQFTNCTADTILRKIAEQAGLNVEVKDGAYFFSRPEPTRKG